MVTVESCVEEDASRSTTAVARVEQRRRSQRFSKGPVWLLTCCWCLIAAMPSRHSVDGTPADFTALTSISGNLQCPCYDRNTLSMYFCASDMGSVNRYTLMDDQLTSVTISNVAPSVLTFVVPMSRNIDNCSNTFAVGMGGSVGIFQWDGQSMDLTPQSTIQVVSDPNTITFGKKGPNDLLYVSTSSGEIFSVGLDHKVTQVLAKIGSPDGFDWSITNPYFYCVDHASKALIAYKYELDTGVIKADTKFTAYDFKANNVDGFPRTVTVDDSGNLWVCFSTSNLIVKLQVASQNPNPNITELSRLELPDVGVNYITFGPKEEIYVATSSMSGMDENAGNLLRVTNMGV